MVDISDLHARGLRRRQKMFGEVDVAKRMAAAGDFGTPLQNIINAYVYGDVWERSGLSDQIRSLVMLGITVALIDHVTKPRQDTASGAALYARGGGAKIDAVSGAAYAFETIESWTRESNGSARLTCAKDREGHRRRVRLLPSST